MRVKIDEIFLGDTIEFSQAIEAGLVRGPKLVMSPGPREWNCEHCGRTNPSDRYDCRKCGAPKERGQ